MTQVAVNGPPPAARDIATGSQALLNALRNPECYPHPVRRIEILETHISWIILTGDYAYKIKKPVNLEFLNFTSLAARRHYCEEEVRLNRRLAPQLYIETVAINGSCDHPVIRGKGKAVEYAVVMHEFPQTALLDVALARGAVNVATIETLAHTIAAFHAGIPSTTSSRTIDPTVMALTPAMDNFSQVLSLLKAAEDIQTLEALRDWSLREYERISRQLEKRIKGGSVRECHGDLHLGNIVLINDRPTPFDCLEFCPQLRWIDVMSEAAFMMMDLEAHGRSDLAHAFLNAYLETTGDYDGVCVLPFYLVYRAIVRAKISLIRASQFDAACKEHDLALATYHRYMTLAARYTAVSRGAIIITHGLSGSGKTSLTQALLSKLDTVRVRSDLERKRLNGVAALARTRADPGGGIYSVDFTDRTYNELAKYAGCIANAGIPAIIDATFLKREYRMMFRHLAQELGVPFSIISIAAPDEILRARIAARSARDLDASEATVAILERQIASSEPLTRDELRDAVLIDASRDAVSNVAQICIALANRLRAPEAINSDSRQLSA